MNSTDGILHGPLATMSTPSAQTKNDQKLLEVSQELEATFLAEMLKSAGFGKTPDAFGGGTGEDQFSSFLVQEQAKQVVKSGGIGLAEQIFHVLKESTDDAV